MPLARHLLAAGSRSIEFVGAYGFFASSDRTPDIALTSLTGGLSSAPQADDFVVVAWTNNSSSNLTGSVVSSGWTKVADEFGSDSYDCNMCVIYKVMGASPDTSVEIDQGTSVNCNALVYVLRNADQSSPLDTATQSSSGSNGAIPDPPSITTVRDNSVVLAIGAASEGGGIASFTAPSGYDDFHYRGGGFNMVGIGKKRVSPAGTENPGAFGGGSSSTTGSRAMATMAIRTAS